MSRKIELAHVARWAETLALMLWSGNLGAQLFLDHLRSESAIDEALAQRWDDRFFIAFGLFTVAWILLNRTNRAQARRAAAFAAP